MKTSGEVNSRKDKKRKAPHKPQHLRLQPNSRKQRTYSNAKKSGEVNCTKDKKSGEVNCRKDKKRGRKRAGPSDEKKA